MENSIIKEDLKFITNADIPWENLEGKNILISGANGFLSAYLVETILFLNETKFKNKAKVFALVRNKEKALNKFKFYKDRNDLIYIIQDVCKSISIKEEMHYIIHAASQASPKYYCEDPIGTLSANVFGAERLLELAREKKVESFLFFSSSEVYGQVSDKDIPIKENIYGFIDPINVRSCYAESKRLAETMCICWSQQYGVPAKIVRPFHIYGPGMRLDDGRVYADFVSNIINGGNIIIKSDGSAVRAFCYIADAVIAFFTVLLKGKNEEAYNVGNNQGEISIIDLANLLVQLFQDKKLKIEKKENDEKYYIKSKVVRSCPDISKIARLGWTPKYSLEEGFTRTVRSFINA